MIKLHRSERPALNDELIREGQYVESVKAETCERIAEISGKRRNEVGNLLDAVAKISDSKGRRLFITTRFQLDESTILFPDRPPVEPKEVTWNSRGPAPRNALEQVGGFVVPIAGMRRSSYNAGAGTKIDQVLQLINHFLSEQSRYYQMVRQHQEKRDLARRRFERLTGKAA